MAKKGDWVRIHNIVLKAEQRTGKLPEDTRILIFRCGPRASFRKNPLK